MAKSQLDFSGARGIIDPLEGLKTSVQQTNSTLGQMIVQNEAEKQEIHKNTASNDSSQCYPSGHNGAQVQSLFEPF